jgi:5'(3')-deoxyribonucleotidase
MPKIGITKEHAAYVALGYCAFVHDKTWCNGMDGHPGEHFAQCHNLNSSGKIEITQIPIGPSKETETITPVLLIDMDNVLVDLFGYAKSIGLMNHHPCRWDFDDCCSPYTVDYVCSYPGVFENASPIEGAIEGVALLMEHFDVYFCSSPWLSNPESYSEKARWIDKYFESTEKLILCQNKALIPAACLIDDKPGITGPWTLIQYPQNVNNSTMPTWVGGLANRVVELFSKQKLRN